MEQAIKALPRLQVGQNAKPAEAKPAPKVTAVTRGEAITSEPDRPATEYDLGSGPDVTTYFIGRSRKNQVKVRKVDGGYRVQISDDGTRFVSNSPMPRPDVMRRVAEHLLPLGSGGYDKARSMLRHKSGEDVLGVQPAKKPKVVSVKAA